MKIEMSEPFTLSDGVHGVLVTIRFGGEWQPRPLAGETGPAPAHVVCATYSFATHGLSDEEIVVQKAFLLEFHAAREGIARSNLAGISFRGPDGDYVVEDHRLRLRGSSIEMTLRVRAPSGEMVSADGLFTNVASLPGEKALFARVSTVAAAHRGRKKDAGDHAERVKSALGL